MCVPREGSGWSRWVVRVYQTCELCSEVAGVARYSPARARATYGSAPEISSSLLEKPDECSLTGSTHTHTHTHTRHGRVI